MRRRACPAQIVSVIGGGYALIAQSVEHVLGKNGVRGSNPLEGSASPVLDAIARRLRR